MDVLFLLFAVFFRRDEEAGEEVFRGA